MSNEESDYSSNSFEESEKKVKETEPVVITSKQESEQKMKKFKTTFVSLDSSCSSISKI